MELTFRIKKFPDRKSLGEAAGAEAGEMLRACTGAGKPVVAVFAAAPSQDEFLERLVSEEGIDWAKVHAFHLDEYHDLPAGHPNTFESYLKKHVFGKVPIPGENIHLIKELDGSPEEVSAVYASALKKAVALARRQNGLYVNFIGIGVNGHIAFNEPGTDTANRRWMSPIVIDDTSVKQQFEDYRNHPDPAARYAGLEDVPRNALTMTCSAILASDVIFAMVPGSQKTDAVRAAVEGPVTGEMPASLLRLHENTTLFLDADSGKDLTSKPAAEQA